MIFMLDVSYVIKSCWSSCTLNTSFNYAHIHVYTFDLFFLTTTKVFEVFQQFDRIAMCTYKKNFMRTS